MELIISQSSIHLKMSKITNKKKKYHETITGDNCDTQIHFTSSKICTSLAHFTYMYLYMYNVHNHNIATTRHLIFLRTRQNVSFILTTITVAFYES